MNEVQGPPPQQVTANPTSVTPEPFSMDVWRVQSEEEFASLCGQWYQTLSMLDSAEASDLCFRFLAYAIVEHEEYFNSFFVNHPDTPCVTHILENFAERGWIQEQTGHALKSFIINVYIAFFKEDYQVTYRKLNEHGSLSELVSAKIVDVHQGILGSYTIEYEEEDGATGQTCTRTKDTTIYRIQHVNLETVNCGGC